MVDEEKPEDVAPKYTFKKPSKASKHASEIKALAQEIIDLVKADCRNNLDKTIEAAKKIISLSDKL